MKRFLPAVLLAILVTLAAVALFLITEAWDLNAGDWVGAGWGLVSAAVFATYLFYGESLGRTYSSITMVTWTPRTGTPSRAASPAATPGGMTRRAASSTSTRRAPTCCLSRRSKKR